MTIDDIHHEIMRIATQELTTVQLETWTLHVAGLSQRAISYRLDVSRTTVTDRLDAAWRTLRKHGIMVTPDGRPYLAEQEPA